MKYIFQYGPYLDAHDLGAMHIEGDQQSMYDIPLDKYRDTVVGP